MLSLLKTSIENRKKIFDLSIMFAFNHFDTSVKSPTFDNIKDGEFDSDKL